MTYQTRGGEGAVDIKEADGVLERALLKRRVRWRSERHCESCGVKMVLEGGKKREMGVTII